VYVNLALTTPFRRAILVVPRDAEEEAACAYA
jgi:hypothetical protein